MKLTAKTLGHCALFLLAGGIIGTLAWEIIARIVLVNGVDIAFSVGPVGFDVRVISLSIFANPGTILGSIAGTLLFFRL